MEIKCFNCSKIFIPSKAEKIKISEAIKKEQKLFMAECTMCYQVVPINPCNLLQLIDKEEEEIIQCPICKDGLISFIKNETEEFYGCGECGNIWKNKNEINNKK
jgi:uncharacterized Zn finger protein